MRKRPIEASTRRVENSPINRGGEKIRKITQVGKEISVKEKKMQGKCACCFGSKFVL